jgi:hypothetical protein
VRSIATLGSLWITRSQCYLHTHLPVRSFFFFPFLSTDSRQPTAHPSISPVAILVVGTSQRTKTFYQEGRCMLGGGFEPSIWWVWTGYKGWWGQGYFGNDLCLKRLVQHTWPNFHLNWRVSGWMIFIATRWQVWEAHLTILVHWGVNHHPVDKTGE